MSVDDGHNVFSYFTTLLDASCQLARDLDLNGLHEGQGSYTTGEGTESRAAT